jgi:cell division septation protein DedD
MEKLRESPILNSIVNEKTRPTQLVLLLIPHIVGTPEAHDVVLNSVPPPPQMRNQFTVQIGAFESGAHARTLLAGLTQRYKDAFIQETNVAGKPFYRVRVGRFADTRQASLLEKQLRSEGMAGFVAHVD